MNSVVVVVMCLVIPLGVSYRGSGKAGLTAKRELTNNTVHSLHWRRRFQHASCGLVIASGYKWVLKDAWTVVAVLCFCCMGFLGFHTLRCRIKALNEVYIRTFGPLLRPNELRGLPGAFWFLLGTAAAVAIFPRDIALQSIVHLSVGDPVASIAGISLGDRNQVLPAGKSLAGSFAAFLACATSTLLLFGWCRDGATLVENPLGVDFEGSNGSNVNVCNLNTIDCVGDGVDHRYLCTDPRRFLFFTSFLGGLSGAIGELLPLRMDDNLSMPLVSGAMFMTLYRWFIYSLFSNQVGFEQLDESRILPAT